MNTLLHQECIKLTKSYNKFGHTLFQGPILAINKPLLRLLP